jgi:tetratricopeptide (TPR) repeat protein
MCSYGSSASSVGRKSAKSLKMKYTQAHGRAVKAASMRRWFATETATETSKARRNREEQLEEELAMNHPEVLALAKIRQHKPARALEVLRAPVAELKSIQKLSEEQTMRLHHLLGLRLRALLEMGEIREALFVVDEQMALLPKNAEGLSNRGLIQAAAGDHFSAATSQREAIELANTTRTPQSPFIEAHFRLGVALRNLGDIQGALDSIETVLEHSPAHYDALILRASVNLEMGRMDVAKETFLEAIRMDGARPEAYAELGNLFYGSHAYEHATTFLKEALKRDPQNVDAMVYMGNVLVMTGYLQEAMTTYDSALLEDSQNIKALLAKAALLGRLKKYDESVRIADNVIGRNSNIPQAYLTKGEALEQLEKNEEALQAFDRAISVDPKFKKAYNAQFRVMRKIGRRDELLEATTKAINELPEFVEAYISKGLLQTSTRNLTEARATLEKAVEVSPGNPQAIISLASCLSLLREHDTAFATLEKSPRPSRKSMAYLHTLAQILVGAKRFDEAVETIDRALAVQPNQQQCLQLRASVLTRLGRYDEAHKTYDQIIKIALHPGRFHLEKALIYHLEKNYDFALDSFDTAVEIDAMLRPLATQKKIPTLQALGRDEEIVDLQKYLESISVDNPENKKEAQAEIQYRPLQQDREENDEDEDLKELADAFSKVKNTRKS